MTALAAAAPRPTLPTPEELRVMVEKSLDDDQAEEVVVIDLVGRSSFADYMVIASGRSTRHVGSMAEKLAQRLREAGGGGIEIEGMPQCDWVLVDAGDVIVHLFRPEVRSFYNLEKLWSADPPPAGEPRARFETVSWAVSTEST